MSDPFLRSWAIRFDTTDYPGKYIARLFHNEEVQDSVVVSKDLEVIRDFMRQLGLVSIQPTPGDEKNLIEVWI